MFYPHICAGCGSDLLDVKNLLCLNCIHLLPHTGFAEKVGNPVEKIFWGRINIASAMSEFYFSKDSIIQVLIHELKYRGNKEIGLLLGNMMGESILRNSRFTIDALIPLPLFAARQHLRGFNQAEILSLGINQVTNIPLITGNIIRKHHTETQTKKKRSQRWENVKGSFFINNPAEIEGMHILLVDDVVTTGATLEACANPILKIPGVKLSIASLAYATI